MDKAIISSCLIMFSLFALCATIHARYAHVSVMQSSGDASVKAPGHTDHYITALRTLANSKLKL